MQRSVRVAALVAVAGAAACGGGAKPPAKPVAAFDESAWKPPREADIPADSLGTSIKRGLYLLRFTPESLPAFATSNLRCTSCHQDDGLKNTAAPLTGSHAQIGRAHV